MGTAGGLKVHIGPVSSGQTELFMAIEQPEDPIAEQPDMVTIGDFYAAVIEKLKELGEPAFATPSAPQVTAPWFPSTHAGCTATSTDAQLTTRRSTAAMVSIHQGSSTQCG